jgi:hypothetical protein
MKYRMGPCEFEAESKYLTLNMSESWPGDAIGVLRERLEDDGFLLLRQLHDPREVLAARREILQLMADAGELHPEADLMDGIVADETAKRGSSSVRGREHLRTESMKRVVYGSRVMRFFEQLLEGNAISYNYQWLRTAGPGACSTVHCDAVYMGRGTQNLYTCWTPFGEITPDMGPLVLCEGSHTWSAVRNSYGRSDVDRDLTQGHFTNNPAELVDRFGGRWMTSTFSPGDAVIVSMFNLHGSLTNMSNRYRISCDTRYQLASEPIDDRWAGDVPIGHTGFFDPKSLLKPVEESRKEWGIE